jgi:aspartyl/asparaginyl beta-hydroxylase
LGRLQELAALAAAANERRPTPRPIRRFGDLLEALRLHPIARRLDLAFSPERLLADLAAIDESWWGRHLGPYHDGSWESVALWAPRGDRSEQRSGGGTFGATEALERCPYFEQVLAAFPCEKNRVRLMRLRAGGHILRHSDPVHQVAADLIRVHVPVATSPAVRFLVRDQVVRMGPGEVWHVDVRFPHEVRNHAATHRVHLVLDLIPNPAVDALLRSAHAVGYGLLAGYYVRHSLPERLRRFLKVGN